MKTKENKKGNIVAVPESVLLTLVAARLKGRVLFPKKMEAAKKHLDSTRVIIYK